jgi:hypothetical protein
VQAVSFVVATEALVIEEGSNEDMATWCLDVVELGCVCLVTAS